MQTTLRVDDTLYREAKSQASKEGISMSQFFNQALRDRIFGKKSEPRKKISLPIFIEKNRVKKISFSPAEIKNALYEMDLERDLKNLSH